MTFKGFNEIQRERIRSITLKNRELKEYAKQSEDQKSEWSRNNAIDC